MSSTNTQWDRGKLIALGAFLLLSACASEPTDTSHTEIDKSAIRCAHDETLSCVEKMGKTVSCTCSSREDLRDILEPNKQ